MPALPAVQGGLQPGQLRHDRDVALPRRPHRPRPVRPREGIPGGPEGKPGGQDSVLPASLNTTNIRGSPVDNRPSLALAPQLCEKTSQDRKMLP